MNTPVFQIEVIQELRQSADIVDIVSSYVSLNAKGKNFVGVCPFHDDHSPSMVVSKDRQIFNCFTCRTGGNVLSNFFIISSKITTKLSFSSYLFYQTTE